MGPVNHVLALQSSRSSPRRQLTGPKYQRARLTTTRCIPKMDHHCPWTNNCVSHTTFPHFVRFLLYTTLGLSLLQSFLFTRLSHLWSNLDMPSYLGPSPFQLGHMFAVLITNSITLFVLGVLLLRNLWCLSINQTTIEGWEIERHKTLLRRARQYGGKESNKLVQPFCCYTQFE